MTEKDILVVFDFLDGQQKSERQIFRSPREIIVANTLADVVSAVDAADKAAAAGYYSAGFISYEAAPAFDPSHAAKSSSDFPLVWFGVFDSMSPEAELDQREEYSLDKWEPEIQKAEYDKSIERIQSAIRSGETYQTNFTFKLRSVLEGDPLAFYNHLRKVHPVPYGAFIDTGEISIISNSPELFLSLDDRSIVSRPMKGTIPRGRYRKEDESRRIELQNSVKNRAEHIMIVDLMRSDLGKVAETGSVVVDGIFDTIALPTVWQMISTVSCRRKTGVGLVDLLRAAFPPGSVTGAPKARTMEIIGREEASARKVYCGAVGYLRPGRTGTFSVPIRTIIVDNKTKDTECGIGGGVTSGSSADDEYQEALSKAQFLTRRDTKFDLLESLLLENGEYFLLDEHLARLEESALFFGYAVDIQSARQQLLIYASKCEGKALKIRITAGSKGDITIESSPILPTNNITVALAGSPIDVETPFVFHKTSFRSMYTKHKQEAAPGIYDVLLWNESRQLTEFTSANVVLDIEGVSYTPSIECGLLAGTFRKHLLDEGRIFERVLDISSVENAERIWLINSVRKWIPVKLSHSLTDV